jgi:hypothetical protein
MEEEFVPSYKNEEERLKIRKIKDRKDRIKFTILTIIAVIIVFAIIFLGYTLSSANYSKYEQYEEKMNIYGFSQVYNDKKANTREKVTKSEAVKMILSCLYNVPEIDGIALSTEETYSNAIWVEYAIKQGIVTREEVNASNADDKVKYQEVLVWLYNIKAKILDIEPDTDSSNFDIKDINAYNTDQKLAIYDLLNSGVIVTNTRRIDGNQKLYKGKLNELIVNFAEKYNTITVGNAKININEDKIPENANMYPYTLASVQKDVYEIDFVNNGLEGFISPIDYYANNKQYYNQIKNYVENYYNYILTVDYNNISKEQINKKLKKYAYEAFDESVLEKYAEYVKNNHIKLNGKATVQLPCVYFDGQDYRVRVKLDIVVESSDTKDNLLFYDLEGENITYNGDQITLYIDTILGKNELSETLFVKEGTINSMLVKQNSSIVIKEV